MLPLQELVTNFHKRFGHPSPSRPVDFSTLSQSQLREMAELMGFRLRLIDEELSELETELDPLFDDVDGNLRAPNIINVAAEITDLLYVTMGLAVVLGIDVEPVLLEIQRANMTKEPNGDDKPTKPDGWTPPNVRAIIQNQLSSHTTTTTGA